MLDFQMEGEGGPSLGHVILSCLALCIVLFYCQTQVLMQPFAKVEAQGLLEKSLSDELTSTWGNATRAQVSPGLEGSSSKQH